MKSKVTNKRGVSLLVLSVAIIILAILTSAALLSLDETGVVDTAKDATRASSKDSVKEQIENLKNTYIVDNFGSINVVDFMNFLLDEGEIMAVPSANADGSYTITTVSNYLVKLEQDGESNLIITVEGKA